MKGELMNPVILLFYTAHLPFMFWCLLSLGFYAGFTLVFCQIVCMYVWPDCCM